jgi:hypothetical protein
MTYYRAAAVVPKIMSVKRPPYMQPRQCLKTPEELPANKTTRRRNLHAPGIGPAPFEITVQHAHSEFGYETGVPPAHAWVVISSYRDYRAFCRRSNFAEVGEVPLGLALAANSFLNRVAVQNYRLRASEEWCQLRCLLEQAGAVSEMKVRKDAQRISHLKQEGICLQVVRLGQVRHAFPPCALG